MASRAEGQKDSEVARQRGRRSLKDNEAVGQQASGKMRQREG